MGQFRFSEPKKHTKGKKGITFQYFFGTQRAIDLLEKI